MKETENLYEPLPEPFAAITSSESEISVQEAPRKSAMPVRMSVASPATRYSTKTANKIPSETEIITSSISLQEKLAKNSKNRSKSVFQTMGQMARKTKVFFHEAVTGEPVFTDEDWDEDLAREAAIEKIKKKKMKEFRKSIARQSMMSPEINKNKEALIENFSKAPLRLTSEDYNAIEQQVENICGNIREEREEEEIERYEDALLRKSQKKPNRFSLALKTIMGGSEAVLQEEMERRSTIALLQQKFKSKTSLQSSRPYMYKGIYAESIPDSMMDIEANKRSSSKSILKSHHAHFAEQSAPEDEHRKFRKSVFPQQAHVEVSEEEQTESETSQSTQSQVYSTGQDTTKPVVDLEDINELSSLADDVSEISRSSKISSVSIISLPAPTPKKRKKHSSARESQTGKLKEIQTQTSTLQLMNEEKIKSSQRKVDRQKPPKEVCTQTSYTVCLSNEEILKKIQESEEFDKHMQRKLSNFRMQNGGPKFEWSKISLERPPDMNGSQDIETWFSGTLNTTLPPVEELITEFKQQSLVGKIKMRMNE